MDRRAILETALDITGGDRATTHGDTVANHQTIAHFWNAFLKAKGISIELSPLDVANMMEALKIARRYNGAYNPDDYVDGAGYSAIAGEIAFRSQ